MAITVTLDNSDPFGNDIVVTDKVDGSIPYSGYIEAREKIDISIATSSAGYGNLDVFNEQANRTTNHALLRDGDRVRIW